MISEKKFVQMKYLLVHSHFHRQLIIINTPWAEHGGKSNSSVNVTMEFRLFPLKPGSMVILDAVVNIGGNGNTNRCEINNV
jgi:hypothetical protein